MNELVIPQHKNKSVIGCQRNGISSIGIVCLWAYLHPSLIRKGPQNAQNVFRPGEREGGFR